LEQLHLTFAKTNHERFLGQNTFIDLKEKQLSFHPSGLTKLETGEVYRGGVTATAIK